MKKPKPGLVAFWRYDLYPFFLSGTIKKVTSLGYVETREYGPGFAFLPIYVCSVKRANEYRQVLFELEVAHREAQRAFDSEWRKKIEDNLPLPFHQPRKVAPRRKKK